MEWHGERLLPRGLPELVYEVAPRWIARDLKVIAYPRQKQRGLFGRVGWDDGWWVVELFPTGICWHEPRPLPAQCATNHRGVVGTTRFNAWSAFLYITLHEIGHVETRRRWPWVPAGTYAAGRSREDDSVASYYVRYVEQLADYWAALTMERIGRRDPRLGQPEGWIGGLTGIYLLRGTKRCDREDWKGTFLEDYRAARCGGQFAVHHVLSLAWSSWREDVPLQQSRPLRRLVRREAEALGIGRHYIDHAGRRHRFFNYWEAVAVVERLRPLLAPMRAEAEARAREHAAAVAAFRAACEALASASDGDADPLF